MSEYVNSHIPNGPYEQFIKRPIDIALSLGGITIASPLLAVLALLGAVNMGGNPFYLQERPGKDEKIFKIIKFRTMNFATDENGVLLPDVQRLTRYGRFLRSTSLDELPELFNILKGDMSLIGPRPLLVKYLPLYSDEQRHRHDVRPGLTGYAQVHGRNNVTWGERFAMDVYYANNISFRGDLRILFDTIAIVLKRKDIDSNSTASYTMKEFTGADED